MLSKKMQDSLNDQLNAELFSSYLYLSMAAFFEARSLLGFAHWMRLQAQEELGHGLKFYDYINERDGRVDLAALDAPTREWSSPLAAFEAAYDHEQKITDLINKLVDLAIKERDHASQIFLQWFVTEQIEELSTANAVVEKLKLVGDAPSGLFLIDKELGSRTLGEE